MKLVALPRAAGKTEYIVNKLVEEPDSVVVVAYAPEAQAVVDRAMTKAKADPAELPMWSKRVLSLHEAMRSPLLRGATVYIDDVDRVLMSLLSARIGGMTYTMELYPMGHDEDADVPYDWSTEAAGDEPEAWGSTPDPVLDRKWMQEDRLPSRNDESGTITPDVVKWQARDGNLRFVDRGHGNLISSMIGPDRHRPILDLDMPHQYVPSSQSGHAHLYINNVVLNDLEHYLLISTLVQLGILGKGSKSQLDALGMSLTRPPHVKKRVWHTFYSPQGHEEIRAHKNCPKCRAEEAMATIPREERF